MRFRHQYVVSPEAALPEIVGPDRPSATIDQSVGIVLGSAAAVVATRALSSMLYGVSPDDPGTFVAVAVLVALIALLASYAPMRRALRIQPTHAKRAD